MQVKPGDSQETSDLLFIEISETPFRPFQANVEAKQ